MKRNLLLLMLSFLFLGMVRAQDDHFTAIDGDQGGFALEVWAEVQIDGVAQTSSSIEIGMFLNGVCRSTVRVRSWYSGTFYLAKSYCVYDGADQTITFKMYNHDTEEEMECDYTITTTGADMIVGPANNSIVLNFVHETPIQNYEIVVSANPAEGGTVSGNGTYEAGTNATVTAEPAEGYTFVNWTEGGTEVSTQASYTFEVTAARTLVANFDSGSSEPEYPWVVVDPNEGASNAELWAIVQINGEIITDGTNWEVGAFYGDICRGLGNMENNGWVSIPEEDQENVPYTNYLVMMLFGNNGEELNFKLYDLEAEQVHPGVCDVTVTYQHDAAFGDPWEPIILNFVTEQTFTKDIIGYSNNGGWYLIASPIGEVSPENVTNMLSNAYDLYYFDQTQDLEWINYKPGNGATNPGFNLVPGKGYLYAHSTDVTLTFTGVAYTTAEGTFRIDLTYDENADLPGWNLVGNPFAVNAYPGRDFYVMNTAGTEIEASDASSIAPMEGIFVVAVSSEDNSMTFSTTPPQQSKGLVFNLKQNGNVIDRAIVRVEGESTLPKIQLNPNHTKLYIPQDDKNYAVTSINRDIEESLPLNLEVAEDGTYTLSVTSEVDNLEYLTLMDNKTGMQANLLLTPNYQFNASVNDAADRFTVFFRSTTDTSEQFNPILYRNNGLLTVNGLEGEYELQVVDVLGRILSSTEANGEYSHTLEATPGLYTIRLLSADKTYTKKIVVD